VRGSDEGSIPFTRFKLASRLDLRAIDKGLKRAFHTQSQSVSNGSYPFPVVFVPHLKVRVREFDLGMQRHVGANIERMVDPETLCRGFCEHRVKPIGCSIADTNSIYGHYQFAIHLAHSYNRSFQCPHRGGPARRRALLLRHSSVRKRLRDRRFPIFS